MILSHLKGKLNARKEENFIPVSVRELLSSLEEDKKSVFKCITRFLHHCSPVLRCLGCSF
jgi:hypothetical protein